MALWLQTGGKPLFTPFYIYIYTYIYHFWIEVFDSLPMTLFKYVSAPPSRLKPRLALAGPDAEHGAGIRHHGYTGIWISGGGLDPTCKADSESGKQSLILFFFRCVGTLWWASTGTSFGSWSGSLTRNTYPGRPMGLELMTATLSQVCLFVTHLPLVLQDWSGDLRWTDGFSHQAQTLYWGKRFNFPASGWFYLDKIILHLCSAHRSVILCLPLLGCT